MNESMRLLLVFSLAGLGGVGALLANPIVVDYEERPIQMLSERVEVVAGDLDSTVKGVYRFRQLEDDTPREPDKHVRILVPVFLPDDKSDFSVASQEASPVALVNGKEYRPVASSPLGKKSTSLIQRFPKKAELTFFAIYIPRSEIDETFAVTLRYRQPHFKAGFSVYSYYCPMIFPVAPPARAVVTEAANFVVTFRPLAGQRVELASTHRKVLKHAPEEVSVLAAHLENIVVKVKQAPKS